MQQAMGNWVSHLDRSHHRGGGISTYQPIGIDLVLLHIVPCYAMGQFFTTSICWKLFVSFA